MADVPYTTEDRISLLVGQLGVDLRTDDDDPSGLLEAAIDYGSNQIEFYCSKYSTTELAANGWVNDAATFAAVMWLCVHRLNEVPNSIQKIWDETWAVQLSLIQQGKAVVPRAATSKNPLGATNYHVDLRRLNNQIRVDKSRSVGKTDGYVRPIDYSAPDQR